MSQPISRASERALGEIFIGLMCDWGGIYVVVPNPSAVPAAAFRISMGSGSETTIIHCEVVNGPSKSFRVSMRAYAIWGKSLR